MVRTRSLEENTEEVGRNFHEAERVFSARIHDNPICRTYIRLVDNFQTTVM